MPTRVAIVAQDLIWADRLSRAVQAAGGQPERAATAAQAEEAFGRAEAAIVDLTAHAYDGLALIAAARAAGLRVIAAGQHDDQALRKRALAAGAERVFAYRKLFEDGPATVAGWLAADPVAPR